MRHARKSSSGKFHGYNGAVDSQVDTGLAVAAGLLAANAHDSSVAETLVSRAEQNTVGHVDRAIADTAFGTGQVQDPMAARTTPVDGQSSSDSAPEAAE